MNASHYAKIIKSADYNNATYSIGFRRLNGISKKAHTAIFMAYFIEHRHEANYSDFANNEYAKAFFTNMTEDQYKQYILTH